MIKKALKAIQKVISWMDKFNNGSDVEAMDQERSIDTARLLITMPTFHDLNERLSNRIRALKPEIISNRLVF